MNVNSVSINNNNSTNSLKFTGLGMARAKLQQPNDNIISENGISLKASKLVKKLSHLIEEDWTKIRKSGYLSEKPRYMLAENDGTLVTIQPTYQQFKNNILMEIEENNHIDRITVNRQKPSDYIYERATITPAGFASGRTYNSMIDKNKDIESRVNSYLEKYITNLFNRDDIKLELKYE